MAWAMTLHGRVARGTGAFLLADLITGLAAFSVITLGGLWLFSATWLRVSALAASKGVPFGSPGQTELAWVGVFVCFPLAVATVYLAVRAYAIPRDVFRTGGTDTARQIRELGHARSRAHRRA